LNFCSTKVNIRPDNFCGYLVNIETNVNLLSATDFLILVVTYPLQVLVWIKQKKNTCPVPQPFQPRYFELQFKSFESVADNLILYTKQSRQVYDVYLKFLRYCDTCTCVLEHLCTVQYRWIQANYEYPLNLNYVSRFHH